MRIPTRTRIRSGTTSPATSAAAPRIPRSSTRSNSPRASVKTHARPDQADASYQWSVWCARQRQRIGRRFRFCLSPSGLITGARGIECRMFQTRTEDMSVERKPAAFGDLRGWIAALKAQGELNEINAEVDWNIELGTIMRLAQG